MKRMKFLTLTLLVLAICMTSVSASAALAPTGTYEDGIVNVRATSDGSSDVTVIATRQADALASAPAFSDAEVLASIVYIDQIAGAGDVNFAFAPARVAEGDTVSVFMAGGGASEIEVANVSLEEEEEVVRTLTLNLNGGSLAEAAPESYPAEGLTLPIPTKAYNTFLGWYANAEFTGDAVTAIAAETEGAKEFWAKWGANLKTFASDAGYTAETVDAEEKAGLISVTAKFNDYVGDVTEYGFLVYLTADDSVKVDLSAAGASKEFYTVTYGIPAEHFDTDVTFLPFVKNGAITTYGEARVLSVNDAFVGELKYLGTMENLMAQLGALAE